MTLKGKGALVTGSSNGLGLAMARALAGAGCDIVLHGLETPQQMARTTDELAASFDVNVAYVQSDLASAAGVDALIDNAQARMKTLDVLINNAVVRHFAGLESFPLEHWNNALAVNLTAAFRAIQLTLPGMRERGWGRIFNMTSVYGARAIANRVDYVTTKTALLGLTRSVAIETLNQGITCNAICPGSVLTPNIDSRIDAVMRERGLQRSDAVREFLKGKQPTGELVDAAHVGELVVFLCGPSASQITGAMMPIEGGWLAG
ncbi:SDR family oxidoreductase [Paraburkholderia phymatum]|uniref:Short-chain dehydrogenase/reductase SDR n=1 Tax=Paraburkholderia phymatum (strain DSM 17167 / CIP 108236 / LMG 21445 / STM815) TaxID=391038 RepID=B2JV80_PARP8|nr:SDR family oxidoreductase [Paraburkholderia phymatum]ACC74857.1 short-chain dehydrogenase/reductase SDR [Paraburkholderia phymatum STM815]